MKINILITILLLPLVWSNKTNAQTPLNGSFENGLTSWTLGGGSSAESLTAVAFNNQVTATDGSRIAFLSNGPGNTGGPSGNIDGNASSDNDIGTLSAVLNFNSLPAVIRFDWGFPSSEEDQSAAFDDIFDVMIDGNRILSGSTFKSFNGNSPFPNVPRGVPPQVIVSSSGVTNNSNLRFGIPNWTSECITIPNAAIATNMNLQFRVADQTDTAFDSGLLLDNVRVENFCQPPGTVSYIQITNTTTSQVEGKDGGFIFRPANNIKPAVSSNGNILAFVANGDFSTGNPFLYEQVFLYNASTFNRISAFTGDEIHSIEISENGNYVIFSAKSTSSDNLEIYRYNRLTSTTTQITTSSGCDNKSPSINNNGRRIAFLTNCQDDINLGFNSDANQEMVIWNNGVFITNESLSCINYAPKISLNNSGRYASFASDCNYSAQNNDNNIEIYRYDRIANSFIQISNTTGLSALDSVDISLTGRYTHYIANDANGNKVIYRYDNNTSISTFIGLSRALVILLSVTTINDTNAQDVVTESLDILTGETIIETIDVSGGSVVTEIIRSAVTTGASIAQIGSVPHVFYSSNADNLNTNSDVNNEIFRARID